MNILCEPENLLEKMSHEGSYHYKPNIYGRGDAGEKIVKILKEKI